MSRKDTVMRPTRYIVALMLGSAALSSQRVHANGVLVVPMTRTQYVLRDTGPSHGGLWNRLCGRPAQATAPQYVAAPVVEYAIVRDPTKPCYQPLYYYDEQGNLYPTHGGGDCFPSCFVDQRCHCCHHSARHLRPGGCEANYWQAQIDQGYEHLNIQDPGALAYLYRRKFFQRAQ